MTRTLQKWNGAGNDFLVDVDTSYALAVWTPERAVAVCNREHGIGADGLLLAALDDEKNVTMTLLNADGSVAEMSGNGIRCLVAAVRRSTEAQWSELSVSTAAGLRVVEIAMDSDVAGSGTALMGMVTLVSGPEGSLGAADVGNPHVVVRDDSSWSTSDREERARHFQALMPDGANVEFVSVVHPARVSMKVYERGVGWTQACGTGSVAVAAVLHERGETGPRIIVENPGGELTVSLDGHQATLGGPVAFDGEWEWSI